MFKRRSSSRAQPSATPPSPTWASYLFFTPAGLSHTSQLGGSDDIFLLWGLLTVCLLALPLWFYRSQRALPRAAVAGHVEEVNIFPVKSCRPLAGNTEAFLDRFGFEGDRRLMVVDAEVYGGQHAFLTQRQLPRMCLISTEIRSNTGGQTLVLSAPKTEPLELAPSPAANAKLKYVRVWSDNRLVAADMGDEAAAWLSGVLRHKCRLVSASHPRWQRQVDASYTPWFIRWRWRAPQVSFADGYPLLLISSASLEELNRKLPANAQLPMNRFRPNIVVDGCEPFAEDSWRVVRIGDSVFRVVKGCSRCNITTTDQATSSQGAVLGADGVTPEPLATLSTFRCLGPIKSEVYFGQNLVHEWPPPLLWSLRKLLRGERVAPSVRVGDVVQVLEFGEPVFDREEVAAE